MQQGLDGHFYCNECGHSPDRDNAKSSESGLNDLLVEVSAKKRKTPSGFMQPYVDLDINGKKYTRDYNTERGAKNEVDRIAEIIMNSRS